jgi:hypothetical protein
MPTTASAPTGRDQLSREHQQVRDLARVLDSQFRIPGTQRTFGVDALVGLIPGVGDVAGLVMSAGVIMKAIGLGARGATVGRMILNSSLDAVVGTVPVLGTLFDFVFKANNRNVRLLEQHVTDPEGTRAASGKAVRRTMALVVVAFIVVMVAVVALLGWLLAALF